jgi:dTDP-4-dehydrorhamnose reductase
MKILVLGIDGMLGSMVFKHFEDKGFDVSGTSRKRQNIDRKIFYYSVLEKSYNFEFSNFSFIINCLGKIKQQINETDFNDLSETYKINSIFPHYLSASILEKNCKIIQIATDCVFSGGQGLYAENSKHELTDHYSISKSLGEVVSTNIRHLRCSLIGPEKSGFNGLFEWFNHLPKNAVVQGFKNHIWNGVTTICFANLVEGIVSNQSFDDLGHITHLVPSDMITKFDLLSLFKDYLGRDDIRILPSYTEEKIDRTLSTIHPKVNQSIWGKSKYQKITDIDFLVKEMIHNL